MTVAIVDALSGIGDRVLMLGRQDSTINVGGSKVYPLAVETVLLGIPFIAIVQAYALVLRDFYGARPAGWRLGFVMLFTLGGMALGGWLAGIIFDATASYIPAFKTGIAFNAVNLLSVGTLYRGWRRVAARRPAAVPA